MCSIHNPYLEHSKNQQINLNLNIHLDRSQLAGNELKVDNTLNGTSEITRKKNKIKIKIKIKTHLKSKKPITNKDFGFYLAGLIDGDGHISLQRQIIITFSSADVKLAYYIKSRLKCGNVRKVKDKNAYIYVISNQQGLLDVLHLINDKLRTESKILRIQDILSKFLVSQWKGEFKGNVSSDLDNWWLAGFCDADASFQIKILDRPKRLLKEIRLKVQIDQKHKDLLLLIQKAFNGYLGYRASQNTYYYESTSFANAYLFILYFDRYSLLSNKFIAYKKWRAVYRLYEDKKHLTLEGIHQIKRIKDNLNKSST